MRYNLRQLTYIECARKHGSIAAAADELRISRSSIAAAVDAFEEQFQVQLFLRQPSKGLVTTPAGRQLTAMISQLLHQANTFEIKAQGHTQDLTGELTIGCFAPLAPLVMPNIIRALTLRHPMLRFRLLEGDLDYISGLLNSGRADVVLSYDLAIDDGVAFEKLGEAPPYVLLSDTDPLAERDKVSLKEMALRPMVLLDLPESRAYFALMFKTLDMTPNIAFRTETYETLRGFVAAGLGYSILNLRPKIDLTYTDARVVAVPLVERPTTPSIGLHRISNGTELSAVEAFCAECRTFFASKLGKRITVH